MIEIIILSLISSIILFSYGLVFCYLSFNQKISDNINFYETSLFGVIFLSFIALLINFFLPLNKIVGTFSILTGLIIFVFFIFKSKNVKTSIKFLLYTSLISFVLIVLANVNRPDAGLYHLPYISIINESKIILGVSNIHFRFGHISSAQYLSAIYNNILFSTSSITMPLASIASIFIMFTVKEFLKSFNSNKFYSLIFFFIFIYVILSFNRYSSYGNDAPAHFYYLFLIIVLLKISKLKKIDEIHFYKITYISVYLISLKVFMGLTGLIPLFLFFYSKIKKQILINKNFVLCTLFFSSWIIKNILTTGCFIYPIKSTCIAKLSFYDDRNISNVISASEAWSKGWSDQNPKIFDQKQYNENFNWLSTWSNHHLKKIFEKTLPLIIFLTITIIFFYYNFFKSGGKNKNDYKINSSLKLIIVFNLIFLLFWFLKFPLYRYGSSFVCLTIILLAFFICKKVNFFIYKKYFNFIIILAFFGFFSKNSIKIIDNFNQDYFEYPWPRIYSLKDEDKNIEKNFQIIKSRNQNLYYYSSGELCMYSRPPCTNFKLNQIEKINKFSFDIYSITK
ncbi:LIC_10190 family membrane protein [Candidatus Pelagibacter sp. HIMB1748]|uniref:LIC_10190 family membrane protein n=1 Tax=unclassified Candidatus Pelagibacter TaxID=2647897 RepID=UPI003F87D169